MHSSHFRYTISGPPQRPAGGAGLSLCAGGYWTRLERQGDPTCHPFFCHWWYSYQKHHVFMAIYIYIYMVGGLEHEFFIFHNIWDVILPIDALHHFSLLHHQPVIKHVWKMSYFQPCLGYVGILLPIDQYPKGGPQKGSWTKQRNGVRFAEWGDPAFMRTSTQMVFILIFPAEWDLHIRIPANKSRE